MAIFGVLPAELPFPAAVAGMVAQDAPLAGKGLSPSVRVSRGSGSYVVVLDAAHGGAEDGGQLRKPGGGPGSATMPEKSLNLELSVRMRSQLAARGVQVVTTRESNVSLSADERAQIANRAVSGAAVSACLSLHASEAGSGVHVFVSSLPELDQAAAGKFLAWKTAQSVFVARSLRLASTLNSALEQSSAGSDPEALHIPVTLVRTGLPGVESMACPAVAIEMAPVRGTDGAVIAEPGDAKYVQQLVIALVGALEEWRADSLGEGLPGAVPATVPATRSGTGPGTGPGGAQP